MSNRASRRKLDTIVATAWITTSVLAAFHIGNGNPGLTVIYLWLFPGIPGAIIIVVWYIKRLILSSTSTRDTHTHENLEH